MPVDPDLIETMRRLGEPVPQTPAKPPTALAPPPQSTPAPPAPRGGGIVDPQLLDTMKRLGEALPGAAGGLGVSPFSPEATLQRQREGMTHPLTQNLPGGRAAGVDYSGGTNFADRRALLQADNPEEKKLYLNQAYGPENVFQDQGGQFFVKTKEGKFVAPEGGSMIGGFFASLSDPTAVGGTLGGVAGGAVGGPPGAFGGAMLGGAIGKTTGEIAKSVTGTAATTLPQKAQAVGTAGLEMGAGEAGGRLVTGIPGALGRFFREKIAGVTPETRQMAASIERLGGAAPLRSVTPGLASPIQKQDISTKLGADWLAQRNTPVVQRRLRQIIGSVADNPQEADRMAGEILDPTSAISSREAGEVVQGAVRRNVATMQGDVTALQTRAQRSLDTQFANIERRLSRPTGTLGTEVADALSAARQDFSNQAQQIYTQIDQMVGNDPAIVTGTINKAAKELLAEMPKTKRKAPIFQEPKVLDSVKRLTQLSPKIRFSDAQQIRSVLGGWATQPDLAGTLPKRQFEQLRAAVDQAFEVTAATDPAVQPAVSLLRRADVFYHDGIRKFENLAINRLANDIRDGIVADPEVIANNILREGQGQQAAAIKRMMPPATWEQIAGADWQNMLRTVTNSETGNINSRMLAREIADRDRSGLLDLTYGPRARDIRLYSQRLSAFNQEIPASELGRGSFAQTVRVREVQQAKLDAYMRDNYLAALARPGSQADQAVNWIVQPGNETRLLGALKEFGETSPQMRAIRIQALKETLNKAVIESETGVGATVSGTGIEKALSAFTPRQQEILFPGGLGEDMRTLAKQIRAMFPARRDQTSGGLIAGSVRNAPLFGSMGKARAGAITGGVLLGVPGFLAGPAGAAAGAGLGGTVGAIAGGLAGGRLARTAYYEGLAWIYSNPATVRVLTQGLRPGPKQAATRETVRMIFRSSLLGTLPQPEGWGDPGASVPPRLPTAAQAMPSPPRPPPLPPQPYVGPSGL